MASTEALTRRTARRVKRAAANPWLEFLERAGYVVRGALYAVMGLLALGLALGRGGAATDQSGSLAVLSTIPFGKVLVICFVVGLGPYAVWGFVRAIFDPLHRGDDAPGIAERLGFAWSGFAYGAMVVFALQLLAGGDRSPAHDSVRSTIASILHYPAGEWAAVGIGAVAIGVGLGQFVEAYTAIFRKDFERMRMARAEKKIVDALGRFGFVSRGVVFTLVGWFVVQGGLRRDAGLVHGYGGAFVFLLDQPFGRLLLAAVSLGFVALGLHSLACARWIRLLGSRR